KYLSLNPYFSVTYVPEVVYYYVTLACRPQEFSTVTATQFGSGWPWLIIMLQVMKTPKAENPLAHGKFNIVTDYLLSNT
ncbi:MAG: Fe-Mn family superoxide dismutase, partial [Dolichospermum sp.]